MFVQYEFSFWLYMNSQYRFFHFAVLGQGENFNTLKNLESR